MSVIVLNRNYEFWTEAPIKKVLKWFCQDKIEIVVTHETEEVGSVTFRIKMPLVVRLLNFVGYKPKSEIIPFSQEAIFNRDNNVCQYYHKDEMGKKFRYKCNFEDRTVDHVIPVSQGGKSEFRNCVCACRTCNEILKKNKTPREAGMELIRIPVIPKRDKHSYVQATFTFNPKNLAHVKYLRDVLGK
jgi:5-methylcytosine-specific restriction endonuclease McrA